ncbi:GGDEF domain-containing protein [Catellatospora sp. NPDC049609]|uniref:GGDEF domain-containing protein n=1 Tax=Catellatospora sp. NPDC049609 TaxID=3155505 RepID=UPI003420D8BB
MTMDLRRYFTRPSRPPGSRPLPARERLARVGPRLAIMIIALAALLPLLGLVAEREQRLAGAREAQSEARRLAQLIAYDIGSGLSGEQPLDRAQLQGYLDDLRRQVQGDVEVVDLRRNVLADTLPEGRATLLGADAGGQVAATIRDGLPRLIDRDGASSAMKIVVVPIRTEGEGIVGAVLMDYSVLAGDLVDAGAKARRATLTAALAAMAVALALGYLLSRGLVHDLRRLTQVAHRYAEGDYEARAQVSSRGEIRELAEAFNAMAARIAERKAVLTDLATTDPLTGLHNRRLFRTSLARGITRAERRGTPFSLIILDLDHFKSINDRYGHLAGDAVLRQVGELLQRELRADDVAARLGGEEFGVVLPDAGRDAAVVIAERLRAVIARSETVYQEHRLTVTASFGVVCYPEHGQSAGELAERADHALYAAKRAGRDRVHVPPAGHPSPGPPPGEVSTR